MRILMYSRGRVVEDSERVASVPVERERHFLAAWDRTLQRSRSRTYFIAVETALGAVHRFPFEQGVGLLILSGMILARRLPQRAVVP